MTTTTRPSADHRNPGGKTTSPSASDGPWWAPLTDERLGIVRRIEHEHAPSHFPRSFRMVSAVLADTTRWTTWPVDSCGAGYAVADQPPPVDAAVGEAIERYCGNLVARTVRGSFRDVLRSHGRAVDPATLALFSPEQHAVERFPFRRFEADLVTDWAAGHDLLTREPVLAPASLTWASYPYVAAHDALPVTNPVYQPGLAAGPSVDSAVLAALLEVVERDTMVLAWHGGQALAPITAPPWLERLAAGPTARFQTRFVEFPNPFGVRVVGALVRDLRAGYLTLGLAARFERRTALLKALGEGMQLQMFVAGLDNPDGAYVRRLGSSSPLRPWRRDRRYLDDYDDDLIDARDDSCHLQLHLDPRMQERFEHEWAAAVTGSHSADPSSDLAPRPTHDAVRMLAVRIAQETSVAPIAVDVTTPDVAASGAPVRVVRVVAPGTYANSSAAYPFLGGQRWTATTARTGVVRRVPLPH